VTGCYWGELTGGENPRLGSYFSGVRAGKMAAKKYDEKVKKSAQNRDIRRKKKLQKV